MFAIFGLIIVFIFEANFFCVGDVQENTYYNGWRPLSNEKALGNLQRNFIKTPEIKHFSASWNPVMHPTGNVIQHLKYNTDINPEDINIELTKEHNNNYNEMKKTQHLREFADYSLDFSIDSDYLTSSEVNKLDKTMSIHSRKAKKIFDESLENNIVHNENKMDTVKANIKEVTLKETINTSDKSNTYEVTEATEASEIKDLLRYNYSKNLTLYSKPVFKPTTEENLTKKLFNILGNYNIGTNDDLTNYAMSRNKYNSSYRKQSYLYPVSRYNSQNHYPIDPLLAVFLSNYGYYVPGLFGFPGNYHNIYGYLASNNIHNNKPFGAYKIYSDTDSSH